MASLIYDSYWSDVLKGLVNTDTDTIKGMLVTSTYSPNKGTHTRRSDVTNEITGTGYTAGGAASACAITFDGGTHIISATFSNIVWATATITARALVLYKSRGGASSADELVAYLDFLSNISSVASTFTVNFTNALRVNNA